ncbi:MAG: hypothetical protein R6U21_03825 [Thermoplasmatota archaeon]
MHDITKELRKLSKSRKNKKVVHKQICNRSDNFFVDDVPVE